MSRTLSEQAPNAVPSGQECGPEVPCALAVSPESLGRLEAHQSTVHFEVIKPKPISSVWEPVVKNVPKHGKSGNGFVLWDKIEKLTYLRRYWTDFKHFGNFETGIFFL